MGAKVVRELSASEHAEVLYREWLDSLAKFREAERAYDAITDFYTSAQVAAWGVKSSGELVQSARKLAQQSAARDPRQVEAAARCVYFRERTVMMALSYQVERDRATHDSRDRRPASGIGEIGLHAQPRT